MRWQLALLAASLALSSADGQAQLLPAGEFKARDGRPGPGKTWRLTDAQGVALAARLSAVAARTPVVIDYDHQTLHVAANGGKAPAAGWIKSAEWRAGKGLFATVEWTAAAKALIDAREYRYISPVIVYDDHGNVLDVHLAALLNHPALTGMEAAVAQLGAFASFHHPEIPMDLLNMLCTLLGLAAGTDQTAVLAAITALKQKADSALAVPQALATALGLKAGADEAAALSAITTLQASGAGATQGMVAMQAQLAALQAQINGDALQRLIDQALADGKLIPAQVVWAKTQSVEALGAYLAAAPVMPLGTRQSSDKGADQGSGGGAAGYAALSANEADVLKRMGVTAEAYDKQFKRAA